MANKVVIVDDSEDMLDIIQVYLEELEIQVIRTNSPTEVIHLIEKEIPDLIISDMIMPDMDGTKLFETIRANKSIPFIPFMLMTAFDHRDIEKYCYSFGIDEFILKPINKATLQERVKRIISLTKDYTSSNKGDSLLYGKINEQADKEFINQIYNVLMVGKTGFFEIDEGSQGKHKIWIVDGEIHNAMYQSTFGKPALQRILGIHTADYIFIEGDYGVIERKIKDSSMDLILHLCQNLDENNIPEMEGE